MAKKKTKEDVAEERSKRAQEQASENEDVHKKQQEVRQTRRDAITEQENARRQNAIDAAKKEDEEEDEPDPVLHDGKPGSGAGLKPGEWHAPKSNPGAAARVPTQPLQPESLQSHGKGILYDKDLDNPPFDTDDPEEVDAPPFGSPSVMDKEAELEKAENATSRFKQRDPDNPTIGAGGRKDATASPEPIGRRSRSKNAVSGGSNSGEEA